MIEDQIDQDLKAAMLARDTLKVETLRGIKTAIQYVKVDSRQRDVKLTDQQLIPILTKESKKRQESADLYKQGGDQNRADKELSEKQLVDSYLPEQMSVEQLAKVVDDVMGSSGEEANMGQIISQVKERTSGAADGAEIAKLVKERLTK